MNSNCFTFLAEKASESGVQQGLQKINGKQNAEKGFIKKKKTTMDDNKQIKNSGTKIP